MKESESLITGATNAVHAINAMRSILYLSRECCVSKRCLTWLGARVTIFNKNRGYRVDRVDRVSFGRFSKYQEIALQRCRETAQEHFRTFRSQQARVRYAQL